MFSLDSLTGFRIAPRLSDVGDGCGNVVLVVGAGVVTGTGGGGEDGGVGEYLEEVQLEELEVAAVAGPWHTGSDSMPWNHGSDISWHVVSLCEGSFTSRDLIRVMADAEIVERSGVLNEQSMILSPHK